MELGLAKPCVRFLLFGLVSNVANAVQVSRADPVSQDDPVSQVVDLLRDMKTKIETSAKKEEILYKKHSCWCEDTVKTSTADITKQAEEIDKLHQNVARLAGDIASFQAEMEQSSKYRFKNQQSSAEAIEMRDKAKELYQENKAETEQCINALQAAIEVFTKGKSGFLEAVQAAQLLSVAGNVQRLLVRPLVSHTFAREDLDVVRRFAENPEEFVGSRRRVLSATQIMNNPFGDYAPQSSQIQGILKNMLQTFTADLLKNEEKEQHAQKIHQELMETKGKELTTLMSNLERHEEDHADRLKEHADSKVVLSDSTEQLKSDKTLLAQTKETCRNSADEWAKRSQLRAEELHGIKQAIEILEGEKPKISLLGVTSFAQISEITGQSSLRRDLALHRLQALSEEYRNLGVAKIILTLKDGGHFDKIISMINEMYSMLEREQREDIEDRDRCLSNQQKNANSMEDLQNDKKKVKGDILKNTGSQEQINEKVKEIEESINGTLSRLDEIKGIRIEERDQFIKSVREYSESVQAIEKAAAVLAKFHGESSHALLSINTHRSPPQPDLAWKGQKYEGHKEEHQGVIAILAMIKEKMIADKEALEVEEASAQNVFDEERKASLANIDASNHQKQEFERSLARLDVKLASQDSNMALISQDFAAEEKKNKSLQSRCAWVNSHFKSRKEKRLVEMQSLVDAKSYLAGAETEE